MPSMFITAEDTTQRDSFIHSISFHFRCVSREVGTKLELGCIEIRYITVIELKGLKIVLFATIVR